MGKGDKKSKRGKISIGSYGVRRRRKESTPSKSIVPKAAKVTHVDSSVSKANAIVEKLNKPKAQSVESDIKSSAIVAESATKETTATDSAKEKPKASAEKLATEIKTQTAETKSKTKAEPKSTKKVPAKKATTKKEE